MSESNSAVENIIEGLRSQSLAINGWEYEDDETVCENIRCMAAALIDAIKDRDARINRLHAKIGQLAEKL